MKRILMMFMTAVLVLGMAGCGASQAESSAHKQYITLKDEQNEEYTEGEISEMIKLTIGDNIILAKPEDNAAANELIELLKNGPVSMPASNYGGFEKVCTLGTRLTSNDEQTTTQPGDIMLYSSSQVVIFYGSNSWAYTKLAKVVNEDIPGLKEILSGNDDKVIIELTHK